MYRYMYVCMIKGGRAKTPARNGNQETGGRGEATKRRGGEKNGT